MSLSCRITWTSYAGKENIEDSWPDIISTGDLDSLHNTTLLETSITFPAAPLCSYTLLWLVTMERFIGTMFAPLGNIHLLRFEQDSHLYYKAAFSTLSISFSCMKRDTGLWWQCFILMAHFQLFQWSWKKQTSMRLSIPTFTCQLVLLIL